MYMNVLRVETCEHISPWTIQRVLKKDPKAGQRLPRQCPNDSWQSMPLKLVDALLIGGVNPHIDVGFQPLKCGVSVTNEGEVGWHVSQMTTCSMPMLIEACNIIVCTAKLGLNW